MVREMSNAQLFMRKKLYKIIPFMFILFFFGAVNYAESLQTGPYQITPKIDVKKIPTYPRSNGKAIIKIESFTFDLTRSFVSFYLNGEVAKQGVGIKSFSFKTGDLGSSDDVKITAKTKSKGTITKEINISPSKIDIVWEADTYTPPFYKGKALQSAKSAVTIEAMPELYKNGVRQDPEGLYYKWERNFRVIKEGFGANGKSLTIKNTRGKKSIEVSLEVENTEGSARTKRYMEIPVSEPEILFYEKNPLMGIIYKDELGEGTQLEGEEITIDAEPYFFSMNKRDFGSMRYNWEIDGKNQEATGHLAHTLTLRRVTDNEGTMQLSLFLRNSKEILQSDGKEIDIKY